jgi:cytochrome c556
MRAMFQVALVVMVACASAAAAHEHATGVVKERMDMMEAMEKHMKAINTRIKAKRDLGAIKLEAVALQKLAPHMVHLFPAGSLSKPTDARKEIWQNWPDFEAKAMALETASANLVNTTPTDFDALFAQVKAVAQACSDCHELYRIKR